MLKTALAQIEVVPGRPDTNTETMLRRIRQARGEGAQLVVFPEMAVPGYLLGDTWEQPAFLRECEACGSEIIAASHGIAVIFGNVAVDRGRRNADGRPRKYNALFAAYGGRLLRPEGAPYPFVIKTLLPDYREFDDSRHFTGLPQLAWELGADPASLAAPVRLPPELGGRTLGCMICEDAWDGDYPFSPASALAARGAEALIAISASPFTLGKNARRHALFGGHAARLGMPFIYTNCTGLQDDGKTVFTFDGSSTVYRSDGRIACAAPAWREELLIFDLDAADAMPEAPCAEPPEAAAIHDALAYGIRRFLGRIGMRRVVIGASGGIDSAVAAALYTEVLGPENVLLINMPGEFSSGTTRGLAARLAQGLGCRIASIPTGDSGPHPAA
ncbi:MAG: hypothetical protein MJ061_06055, partial [Mailhella sp.]|nr:hypothetical protein [Mailhella sp.]